MPASPWHSGKSLPRSSLQSLSEVMVINGTRLKMRAFAPNLSRALKKRLPDLSKQFVIISICEFQEIVNRTSGIGGGGGIPPAAVTALPCGKICSHQDSGANRIRHAVTKPAPISHRSDSNAASIRQSWVLKNSGSKACPSMHRAC
jgi:hypothetical protein